MIKNTRESPNNKREQHSPARPSLLAEPLSRVDDTTTKTKLRRIPEISNSATVQKCKASVSPK